MPLPAIDFAFIRELSNDSIQSYGTAMEFIEQGQTVGRAVKAVIYKDDTSNVLVQDSDSTPSLGLLSPMDFLAPNRKPQQYDMLRIAVSGFEGTWTIISDPHPVFAGDDNSIFILQLRRN